jgi:hypothetical protein
MVKPLVLFARRRRRGNPNWGKPPQPIRAAATEFEVEIRRLGLTKEMCAGSIALRQWCERNKNRCYIPEWLLRNGKSLWTGVARRDQSIWRNGRAGQFRVLHSLTLVALSTDKSGQPGKKAFSQPDSCASARLLERILHGKRAMWAGENTTAVVRGAIPVIQAAGMDRAAGGRNINGGLKAIQCCCC